MHQTQIDLLKLSDTQDLSKLTLREIGRLINVDHPQKIQHHKRQLERKGLLDLRGDKRPMSAMSRVRTRFYNIPIMNNACVDGEPNKGKGFLTVSSSIVKIRDGLFALKVVDDSMNKAMMNGKTIENRDYVIVDSHIRTPDNGEYVVCVVDNAVNIKRFYEDKENEHIVLVSEGAEDSQPIYIAYDDFDFYMILGMIVQVVKNTIL